MKKAYLLRISLVIFFLQITVGAMGIHAVDSTDIPTPSKTENMATPAVKPKQHDLVASYMKHEAKGLKNRGYSVETTRNDEVIVITIPNSNLFYPNETLLLESGKKKLAPLSAYLKTEDRFKLLVVTHSDDTGSKEYKDKLTGERMDAILEYLQSISNFPEMAYGYAMSDMEMRYSNDSRENREKNRRVEIYVVPAEGLIKKLKK